MHRSLAILALATLMTAQPQSGVDKVLKQHLELAEKAHQKNDIAAELEQLQPAFYRAIEVRSLEWIEEIARRIERAYRDIDQPDEGLPVLQRAAESIRMIAGPESVRAAEFEFTIAMKYLELARVAEGQATMTEAVRKIRKATGPDSVLLKESLKLQALMAAMAGGEKESASAKKEAEGIDERRGRKNDFGFPPDPRISRLLEQARTALEKKDSAEFDRLIKQITTAAERLDIQNPQRAHTWRDVAILYDTALTARADLVDKHLMKALELSEAALGKEQIVDVMHLTLPMVHLLQVAETVSTLTRSCMNRAGAPDCIALYERYLARFQRALGPNHPAVGGWLGQLSYFLYFAASQERSKMRNAGVTPRTDPRFQKAISYRRRELSIYELAFGADDFSLVQPLRQLAEMYQSVGDAATARSLGDRALKIQEAVRPAKSEEQMVKYEVRQLRLFLRFDQAEDKFELYKTHHPESTLRLE